jgi:glycosyltransferase involved in cell wall biosynthesis
VLSWSLLEAMSAGCFVVSSRTPPVEEVMQDEENGQMVDFFDVEGLADRVATALAPENDAIKSRIRANARESAIRRYDVNKVCLPAYFDLLRSLLPTGEPL